MKKFMAIILTLAMVMSLCVVPASAAGSGVTITITPDKSRVDTATGDAVVTYTVKAKVTDPSLKVGALTIILDPGAGLTLAEETKKKNPDFYYQANAAKYQYNEETNDTGIFETVFSYAPKTKTFVASGTTNARNLNSTHGEIVLMTIMGKIAKGTTGSVTLGASTANYGDPSGEASSIVNCEVPPATVTITKAPISSVTASVETPVAGQPLDFNGTVDSGAPYSISKVEWFESTNATGTPVTGPATAKAKQYYYARITLTAKADETFAASLGSTITTSGDYTVTRNSDTELYLTKAYPETDSLPAATVTAAPAAKPDLKYTGSEQPLLGFVGNANGGTMQYSLDNSKWSEAIPKGKDAKTYTVYYKVKGDSSHSDSAVASISAKIDPKEISGVTIGTIASQSYTGGAITPDLVVTDGTATLTKNTDYTVSCTDNTYVGTNTAKLTITGKGNYIGTKDAYFTIVAADQNPKFTTPVSLATGGARLDLRDLVSNAQGTVTFAIASGTAAQLNGYELTSTGVPGDVTIKVSITASDVDNDGKNEYNEYNKSDAITVNVVAKTKEDLADGVTQDGCTYGESLAAPSYTAPDETTATTTTYTGTTRGGATYSSATAPTEAGNYQVTVKCETATHIYEATSSIFTIAPKPITGAVVTLGTSLTYDTNAQTQNVSNVELDGTDIKTSCDVTDNVQTNAGTYTLKVKAKTTGNYIGEVSKAFTIAKKSITPTITVTGTYEYNGNEIEPNFTVKDGTTALASTDYTAAFADNTNAGTGKITVKEAEHGNYTFSDTPKNFTINKKTQADVTAAGSAKYGANGTVNLSSVIVPGGTAAYDSMNDTNSVLDGTPTVSESILNFKFNDNAANATKTATVLVKVTSTNYTDYNIAVTLTVNDKTTPIVTPPTAKTLTYNGSDQVLINPGSTTGGTLQYSLTSGSGYKTEVPTGKDATTYTVYYKVVGDADFADVTENSVSVVIKQKDVTVAPKNISITKGAAIPAFELTYKGLVSGDNLTVAPTPVLTCFEADGTTPVSTSTAAGTYTITWTNASVTTLTGTGSGNYQVITTPTGTLTINNPSSSSGGGSYVPKVQKPEITIIGSGKADLSADGRTATITANAGHELVSVVLNGKEMGKVEKLTGLKTGDKATITFQAKTDGKAEMDKMIAQKASKLTLMARSAKTAKLNIKVVVKGDLKAITDAGYTVKYKFYRSTKKSAGYKAVLTKKAPTYFNTYGKKGTMYYYKARVMIYDKNGNFVAQTALKQCKYANRLWTK